jgi:predicted DNA-binding protein YlxM (UPF0122 family)
MILNCEFCGCEFERLSRQKYCSEECRGKSQRKLDDNKEKEVINLYKKEFWTVPQLSKKFNCGKSTIHRVLKRNNIKERSHGQHHRLFDDKTEENICQLYLKGKTSGEIGKLYNINYRSVWSILKRHNIKCRPSTANFKGEGNPNWRGGIANEPYCILFNPEFKERVRDFWNRKCGICGKPESKNNRLLLVHHVDYNKKSCCDNPSFNSTPNLFIPLCHSHHSKTNYNRDYWEEMLSNYIMIYFDGKSYLSKGD